MNQLGILGDYYVDIVEKRIGFIKEQKIGTFNENDEIEGKKGLTFIGRLDSTFRKIDIIHERLKEAEIERVE